MLERRTCGPGKPIFLRGDILSLKLVKPIGIHIKQLLVVVEHDIMNYQNRGLCYLPKPKAEADNTYTRF